MENSDYEFIDKIGEGSYGVVYKVKRNDSDMAIKRNIVDNSMDFMGSLKELDILTQVKDHPYMVKLLSIQHDEVIIGKPLSPVSEKGCKNDKVHFIFEAAYDDLSEYMRETEFLKYSKSIMIQLLLGLKFLHSHRIIHRDIKPANILIFKEEDLRIAKYCDFGMSKQFTYQENQTPGVVTCWYRPPEICLEEPYYDYKIDVWSLGCIFYELLTKNPLFNCSKDDNKMILKKICRLLPTSLREKEIEENLQPILGKDYMRMGKNFIQQQKLTKKVVNQFNKIEGGGSYEQYIALITGMLDFFPKDRFSVNDCLRHPFCQSEKESIKNFELDHHKIKDSEIVIVADDINRAKTIDSVFEIFNKRKKYFWYKHRVLFLAIDIYDRFLEISKLVDFYSIDFLVCLYISIKYFNSYTKTIKWVELLPVKYRTIETIEYAEKMEKKIVMEVLEYKIYRKTVYDVATDYLDDLRVRNLLMIYVSRNDYSGKTPEQIYEYLREEIFDGVYSF